MMARRVAALLMLGMPFMLGTALMGLAAPAQAFPGVYVARHAQRMTNRSTTVVLVRDGRRTVVTIQPDYRGPAEDFALVLPVAGEVRAEDVKTLDKRLLARVGRWLRRRVAGPSRFFADLQGLLGLAAIGALALQAFAGVLPGPETLGVGRVGVEQGLAALVGFYFGARSGRARTGPSRRGSAGWRARPCSRARAPSARAPAAPPPASRAAPRPPRRPTAAPGSGARGPAARRPGRLRARRTCGPRRPRSTPRARRR